MNKVLQIPVALEMVRHIGQTAFHVLIEPQAIRDWCLGLCLLSEGLTERLVVVEKQGKKMLEVQTRRGLDVSEAEQAEGALKLTMTFNELEYLQHFFLKYYRDGTAEVDHLDLQARCRDVPEGDCYVTFDVRDAAPPMSADEAKRRLGIP